MEVVNPAEKEASEVLHSLLSVERRALDSKDGIVVSIAGIDGTDPNDYDASQTQWHTPVVASQSMFTITGGQEYTHSTQQVLWQGHTIQIENGDEVVAGETILQELYPIVSLADTTNNHELKKQAPKKKLLSPPLIRTPSPPRKLKKPSPEDEEQELEDCGKLEDNPLQVKARLKKGCDCKDSCYRGLQPESVYRHRLNIAELTKDEHDMYLMGVTMACLANPSETSRRKARRRLRASYVYQGRRVCLEAFLYLENVTHYQLKRIRHHVMTHGVAPRIHGNMGKKPYNTLSLDIYKHATEFLKQYLDRHGGGGSKTPGKTVPIQGDTRRNLYDAYRSYGEMMDPGSKLMGYSTFRCLLKEQFPNVKFLPKKNTETKETNVPFKSGKCMTYDKNKDPVRIEAEKAKNEAKRAAQDAKKKANAAARMNAVTQHVQIDQQQQQQQQQQQVVVQQQLQTVQLSPGQQVQQSTHQLVQQMNLQEDSGSQPIEITQQVIPLTVVQQPQQTYIVTPVSHLQTSVHGTWYNRQ